MPPTPTATETTNTPVWFIRDGQPIVKDEFYDPDVMEGLLIEKGFSAKDLRNLSAYKKSRAHANRVRVIYEFADGCGVAQIGRLYVKGMKGLQSFPHDIRNPLLEKHYWDCDMENAHYWLALQLGQHLGVKTDAIQTYCDNREASLTALSSDREVAKRAFLKTAYGGTIAEFNNDWGTRFSEIADPDGDLTLLKAIEKEMAVVRDVVWSRNTDLQPLVKKKPNKRNSLLALVLQTEERKCLLTLDHFLSTQSRNADVLIHDGLSIRKLENETELPEQLLRGGEKAIKDATGYTMKLAVKSWKHEFQKPKQDRGETTDDAYAAKKFIQLCGDFIQRDGKDIYYFDEKLGMWGKDDDMFRRLVLKFKDQLLFVVMTEKGSKDLNYGGEEKRVVAMGKWILPQLADTKFLSRKADTSIGKLLFEDGIFDFRTGFTRGFDPNIVFLKRIDRPFPKEKDEEVMAKIERTLFVDAFSDANRAVGQYIKKAITMALFGDYRRKKFYIALGESNCGKGVSVSALRSSFCGYVDEWVANEVLYNPNNSQDEARRLAWLKELAGVRAAFSSEIRMTKLGADGNLIKACSSGGDQQKSRANYENAQIYINRATMFMFANDMVPITPSPSVDDGLKERLRYARWDNKFVDNPVMDYERKKDRSIKEKFETDEWKNALFYLIWDCYTAMDASEKEWGGDLDTPEAVKAETKEWINDGMTSFKDVVLEQYEITNDYADTAPTKDFIKYIVEQKMNLSTKKIGMEIRKLIKTTSWTTEQKEKIVEVMSGNISVYHGMRVKGLIS